MKKAYHEIRDPIHTFIRVDSQERQVINSRPFQRLRYIHQLALTYLVYPGATHRRFEHALGVMDLAGRVYDVITHPGAIHDQIRDLLKEQLENEDERRYWRRVLRMAALCHDLGHLPFSHAAEHELLPEGTSHEDLSIEHILSEEMCKIWSEMKPPLKPEHIAKLAVGQKHWKKRGNLTLWEALLSEVVVGDAFGVDRMDYLLRDSLHAGVAYGRFDHYRLIDSLRILPNEIEGSIEPALGIDEGGLRSAEALLLARFFMFSQLYYHPVRRAYDIHLQKYLSEARGKFSTKLEDHLAITDNEILTEIAAAARNDKAKGYLHAKRITYRGHYRVLYEEPPNNQFNCKEALDHILGAAENPEKLKEAIAQVVAKTKETVRQKDAVERVFNAAKDKFGPDAVHRDIVPAKGQSRDFPVLRRHGDIEQSRALSDVLQNLPLAKVDLVFIVPEKANEALDWLKKNEKEILKGKGATDGK